jgi:hypothetical protein
MLRQRLLESRDRTARVDGHSHIGPCMLDDPVEPGQRQHKVRPRRGVPPPDFSATAARYDGGPRFVGASKHRRDLALIPRLDHEARQDPGYRIPRVSRPHVRGSDKTLQLVLKLLGDRR